MNGARFQCLPGENTGDPRQDYHPGTWVAGRYQLERSIGAGGMGTVWLARHETLGVKVALKVARQELRGEETTQRLLAEARIGASVHHPSLVRVFDCGQTDCGDPFVVMELLEGQTLAAILSERKALSPIITLQLLLPVVDALCCVHRYGVVHRDLKPDNIFLTYADGCIQPKLLDFGIAKCDGGHANGRIITGGKVLGSPTYMAPEQALGAPDVDARADVWSVCVVIYEAVMGRPPFCGTDCYDVLRSVMNDEPAPLCDGGWGELELWSVLRCGLAKERAQRFATMQDLGQAMVTWLERQGVTQDIRGVAFEPRWRGARTRAEPWVSPAPSVPLPRPVAASRPVPASPARADCSTTVRVRTPVRRRHPLAGAGLMLAAASALCLMLDAKAGEQAAASRSSQRPGDLVVRTNDPAPSADNRVEGPATDPAPTADGDAPDPAPRRTEFRFRAPRIRLPDRRAAPILSLEAPF